MGRRGRGSRRPGVMGQFSSSRRPHLDCCRRREYCDGRCVVRRRRSSPCPGRRPGAGHGRGARGGAAAITAQPLPPGSSSLPLVATRFLFSSLGGGVRPLLGDLPCSRFKGGYGLKVLSPVSRVEASPRVLGQIAAGAYSSLYFVFFRSVFGYFLLFPPSLLLLLSVWVLPSRKSSPSTLPWLSPALRILVVLMSSNLRNN